MFFGQKVHYTGHKLGQKINTPTIQLGHKARKISSGSNRNYEDEAKARERYYYETLKADLNKSIPAINLDKKLIHLHLN